MAFWRDLAGFGLLAGFSLLAVADLAAVAAPQLEPCDARDLNVNLIFNLFLFVLYLRTSRLSNINK